MCVIIVYMVCVIYIILQILIIVSVPMHIYRQIEIGIKDKNQMADSIIKSAYAIIDHDDIWGVYPLYHQQPEYIENSNIIPSPEWKTNITIINHKNTFYRNH